MDVLIKHILSSLKYIGIFTPIYLLIRLVYFKMNKNKMNYQKEIVLFILYAYFIALISQTILISLPNNLSDLLPITTNTKINTNAFLVFTHTYNSLKNNNYNYLVINLIGNIIAFIPIGILIPMIYKRKIFGVLIVGFLTSFTIETIQLILLRATDVDDIMLNVIGTFIGYLIFRFIIKKHV